MVVKWVAISISIDKYILISTSISTHVDQFDNFLIEGSICFKLDRYNLKRFEIFEMYTNN